VLSVVVVVVDGGCRCGRVYQVDSSGNEIRRETKREGEIFREI